MCSGITGALRHNIKELSVGLGVQLIEYDTVNIEAVLRVGLCRKDLVEAVRRRIHDSLGSGQYFAALGEGRRHSDHVGRNLKDDAGLLPICSAAIHLRSFLTVATAKQKSDRRSEFALSHFFRYFDVGGVELSVPVGFEGAENIPDDLFLPVDQFEALSGPGAFCMAQAFDKVDRIISRRFIVDGVLCFELGRCILLELSDTRSPPKNEYKK